MGIFKARNEEREIFYYLKRDVTLFIDIEHGGTVTFQVLNHATDKSQLDASGWNFEPISNVEFEDVLGRVKELTRLGDLGISESNDFNTLGILGR